jgi:hypothetical protein
MEEVEVAEKEKEVKTDGLRRMNTQSPHASGSCAALTCGKRGLTEQTVW